MINASVDLLVYKDRDCPSAAPEALAGSLLVFWDGRQHQQDRQSPHWQQLEVDQEVSETAAAMGFHVLRVSDRDAAIKMQVIDAAWQACTGAGWVRVSPRWNSGAHHIP